MSTTTNLNSLVINYLTQAQYDAAAAQGQIDENQLYFTPENGEGVLIVEQTWDDNLNANVLNKTWQEIFDANAAIIVEKYPVDGNANGYSFLYFVIELHEGDSNDNVPYDIITNDGYSVATYNATLPTDYPYQVNYSSYIYWCSHANGAYTITDFNWDNANSAIFAGNFPRIMIYESSTNSYSILQITEVKQVSQTYEVDCIGMKDGGTSLFRFKSSSTSGPFTIPESEVITTYTYKMIATLSSAGWYRILNFKTVQGVTLDFTIRIPESNGAGTESAEVHKISYCTTDGAQAIFTKEDSRGDTLSVNKIRRTYGGTIGDEGVWGFDLHYNSSTARTVYVTVSLEGELSSSDAILENLSSVNDAPTGESVWPEYSFAQRTEGDITSLCSLSKTSGSSTATLRKVYRHGNVVHVSIDYKTTASISSGGDMWIGTFNGPEPVEETTCAYYNGQRVIVGRLKEDGYTVCRYAYGSSNLSSGSTTANVFHYLTK